MTYGLRYSASHASLAFVFFGLFALHLSSAYAFIDWETFTPVLNDTLVINSNADMIGSGLSIAIFKHPSKGDDSQPLPGLAFGDGRNRELWILPPELMTELEEAVASMARALDGMQRFISQDFLCPSTTYINVPIGYLGDEKSIDHLLDHGGVKPSAGMLHIYYGGQMSRTFIQESAQGVPDKEIKAFPDALKKYKALKERAYHSRNAESEIPLTNHTKKRIYSTTYALVWPGIRETFEWDADVPDWWKYGHTLHYLYN